MLFMIEDMVMSHGGSTVHLRSGSNAACKWIDTVHFADPFRKPRYSAADLLWVIYVVT